MLSYVKKNIETAELKIKMENTHYMTLYIPQFFSR